jgi:ribosomal protein S18 acetylase RimI-like enzyme
VTPPPEARPATLSDAAEVVRLAGIMFASMGFDVTREWSYSAVEAFEKRLGGDVAVFVVDRPDGRPGLAASGAGVISARLPTPLSLSARVGYIQWVCTDPGFRRLGLGRQVMLALLDWYERSDVSVVELHATADGEPLYRSLGFGQGGGVALRRRHHK